MTLWLPATFCGAEMWTCGLGLDPPHAVSTRLVAVRADRVWATRRTSTSPSRAGPTVPSSLNDRFTRDDLIVSSAHQHDLRAYEEAGGSAGRLRRCDPGALPAQVRPGS